MENHILPFDVLNLILEYDGRIKYIHKEGIYVNIIHKNDFRYDIITLKLNRKYELLNMFRTGIVVDYYIDIYYKNDGIHKGLVLYKKYFS